MKIIKKPVLPVQKCENCGCEFKIKPKEIREHFAFADKRIVDCPVCKRWVYVVFNASK